MSRSVPCKVYSGPSTRGFSLIEVNLAVLLVAVGLLSLFTLFPLGLRESEMGLADTHEAIFADAVLSGLEGNAAAVTNWSDWSSLNLFKQKIVEKIYPVNSGDFDVSGLGQGVTFPEESHTRGDAPVRFIRYKLVVSGGEGSTRREATLYVKSGKYGDFNVNAQKYYTQFIYGGM